MSYFEVPEEDAERVTKYVNGQRYKGREVRCNKETGEGRNARPARESRAAKPSGEPKKQRTFKKEDWLQFVNPKSMNASHTPTSKSKKLKGEIPDFEEEGWAIRKPRKKK